MSLQYTMSSPLDSLLEVGVIKNDCRTLPSQFQCDDFQISLGRRFENFASRESTACEYNFLNEWMFANGLANSMTF